MYTRIQTKSTAELLAEQIRGAVVAGELAPGDALHQERLAARFGVSRSPIREALRLLEAEGLVEYHSNRGATVPELGSDAVDELYEIRELLESALTRRVAKAIGPDALAGAERMLDDLSREAEPRAWLARHAAFHEMLWAVAARPRMAALVKQLQTRVSHTPHAAAAVEAVRSNLEGHDRALLAALRRGNAGMAARAARAHVRDAKATLLASREAR